MALPWDKREFSSWENALREGQLNEKNLQTLDSMVESGESKNREEAAQRLDWQESVVDPDEHMYGF